MLARSCTALALLVIPVLAAAQDGLRSASLPERPIASVREGQRPDLFRATPETYRPDPDRLFFPGFTWPFPSPVFWPAATQVMLVPVDISPLYAGHPAYEHRGPAPPPPLEAYVPGTPGRPKTFYLIAGCYAGDRRPQPDALPPGCSLARLRVIEP